MMVDEVMINDALTCIVYWYLWRVYGSLTE